MPTASRLLGAAILGVTLYLTSVVFLQTYRPGLSLTYFDIGAVVMGFWGGWVVLGKRVGKGLSKSMGSGLLAAFSASFWGLFLFAIVSMFRRTQTFRFSDVEAAFFYLVDQFILYGKIIFGTESVLILALGGIVTGLAAELMKKIWD